jgi:hypothetical protein
MKDRRKNSYDDDRRNNDRVIAKLDITAVVEEKEAHTEMRNLSGNGIQIIEPANIEMQPNQECQIVLKEGNTFLKLHAKVVWKEFGLIGLCFEKQNQMVQKQINKLSKKLSMVALTDQELSNLA